MQQRTWQVLAAKEAIAHNIAQKRKIGFEAAEKIEEKMKMPFQPAIDRKKVLGKERLVILIVTQEGEYFLGQKIFSEDESCNASTCMDFILR